MKRTTEEAFDATLDCISRLECSPLEILVALHRHFERRLLAFGILKKQTDEYPEISKDEILRNLETLVDSIGYVKDSLLNPVQRKELSYDRFE